MQKLTRIGILFLIMGIIFLGLAIAAIFDFFTNTDYKIFPTNRRYAISEELSKEIQGGGFTLEKIVTMIDLRGSLELRTTSRSAQNPITIEAELTPVQVFNLLDERAWSKMPDSLHFVFPEALNYPIERNSFGQPEYAVLNLEKIENPRKYIGQTTLIYEDSKKYPFFLLESIETFQQPENGTIRFSTIMDKSIPLKTDIVEVEGGIGEIEISSYSNTLSIQTLRSTYIIGFLGISTTFFTIFGYNVIKKKSNRKPSQKS